MRTEIIINVGSNESRIAILEEGKLAELFVERPEEERMVGMIYKGMVTSVLPGMQAAFVDIDIPKRGFLPLSDLLASDRAYSPFLGESEVEELEKKGQRRSIKEMLKPGDVILVQITKEPIGGKGPKLTTQLAIPGRFTVLLPGEDHLGVSRKITNWKEKRRLKELVAPLRPEGMGVIVRTEGEGKGEKEFKSDINRLLKTWKKITKKAGKGKAPILLHRDVGITSSVVRDLFSSEVERMVVDSKREYRRILSYLRSVSSQLRTKVEYYKGEEPIFDFYGIEKEIEKMLDRKVWLKRGSYIVIDHTEALVTIDVNSGRYVGRENLEETALRTNLEAAREITRQMRLRDIGGIIVIDFIDMEGRKNRDKVYQELRGAFKRDRANVSILPISDFGLVELTRQRIKPSFLYTFSEACPLCNGTGRVLSQVTMMAKIERWLKRAKGVLKEKRLKLQVHPVVADYLLESRGQRLKKLSKESKRRLEVEADPSQKIDSYKFLLAKDGLDVTGEFMP